jgi:hypothetical protein
MKNDRSDSFMNNEHEETGTKDVREDSNNLGEDYSREEEVPRFLQVNVREHPRDYAKEPSEPPYYFQGEVVPGIRGSNYDPVRVRISKLADKETMLDMLRSLNDWVELNWERLTEDEEPLNSFNGEWYEWSVVIDDEVSEEDIGSFCDREEDATNNTLTQAQTQDVISQEIERLEEGIESGSIEDTEEAQERIEVLLGIMNSCLPFRLSDYEL